MSEIERRALLGAAGLGAMGVFAARAHAGPLTPPSGAVAGTSKPLSELEPRTVINAANTPGTATSVYRISSGGGYLYSGNTFFSPGKSAIEVAASGVIIDLNGFVLSSLGGISGIIASSTSIERITIRNGSILGAPGGAIVLDVPNVTLENIHVRGGAGVTLGDGALVRDCTFSGCNGTALTTGARSRIERCSINDATSSGIFCGPGSLVEGCSVSGCTSTGIAIGAGSIAYRCSATGNRTGISASTSETETALVEQCICQDNSVHGIQVYTGVVRGCHVAGSGTVGIFVISRSVVEGNYAMNNGTATATNTANFRAQSYGNRFERNTAFLGPVGYLISGGSQYPNVLMGNTSSGHTLNWSVSAGCVCLVIASATAGSISGDSGGVSPGSTNPWANFTI